MSGEAKAGFLAAGLVVGLAATLGIGLSLISRAPVAQVSGDEKPLFRPQPAFKAIIRKETPPALSAAPEEPPPVLSLEEPTLPDLAPIPDLDVPKSSRPIPSERTIASERKKPKAAIEVIRDYLTEHLTDAMTFEFVKYSDPPSPVKFKGDRASVVRVIYKVQAAPARESNFDQLFLVQSQEVKQQVNFSDWLAAVQRVQAEMARRQQLAMQQAAQEEMLAQQMMAQQGAAGAFAYGGPMMAQRLQGPCRA